MARLIDADALLETEPEVCADYGLEYGSEFGYSSDQIANAPTVSPDEVRGVGKWIKDKEQNHVELTFHCSVCGRKAVGRFEKTRYCGDCGAKMEVSEDE